MRALVLAVLLVAAPAHAAEVLDGVTTFHARDERDKAGMWVGVVPIVHLKLSGPAADKSEWIMQSPVRIGSGATKRTTVQHRALRNGEDEWMLWEMPQLLVGLPGQYTFTLKNAGKVVATYKVYFGIGTAGTMLPKLDHRLAEAWLVMNDADIVHTQMQIPKGQAALLFYVKNDDLKRPEALPTEVVWTLDGAERARWTHSGLPYTKHRVVEAIALGTKLDGSPLLRDEVLASEGVWEVRIGLAGMPARTVRFEVKGHQPVYHPWQAANAKNRLRSNRRFFEATVHKELGEQIDATAAKAWFYGRETPSAPSAR